jgi:uroporphyrinogen decarboxylase
LNAVNSPFLAACKRKETEYTPVWFMRQAGRYLPSYRRIKGSRQMIELAKDPDLASKVVADAVKSLGVDAGIIFADIMLPLEAIGVRFTIQENVGPIVSNPISGLHDVNLLGTLNPEADVPYVYDGIDATVQKLDGRVPLIGFSGAPFTLAAYMIEGGPSRDLEKTKSLMFSKPDIWSALMKKLTRMVKVYLDKQVKHGAAAVQLFDSWVGCLSASDYSRFVLPFTSEIFDHVHSVPRIHFCADSSALLGEFHRTGPEVLSVDWRVPIGDVWRRCRDATAVQGNLDPVVAMVGGREMEAGVLKILDDTRGRKGHIFSLGHGVLRGTNPDSLRRIVKLVHDRTRERR